jgi:Na+/H+ antiporter NhaD/arsenite permease-like protein
VLTIVTVVLSNLVSYVPAVMLLRPLYSSLGDGYKTALIIASASTLTGNLTVLVSIANLIVLEEARKQKVEISFAEYLRIGLPVTIITLAIDIVLLSTFSPT